MISFYLNAKGPLSGKVVGPSGLRFKEMKGAKSGVSMLEIIVTITSSSRSADLYGRNVTVCNEISAINDVAQKKAE